MALLVHEVTGEDNQVRLLPVDQIDQLLDGSRIALPTADVYVRYLHDAVAVETFRNIGRTIFYFFRIETGDTCKGSVEDIEEADDSQNQSYSGERAAGTTTDDEVRQYSHQRAKHEYGFGKTNSMMVIASLPIACVWFDIALSPVRNMK